MNHRINILLGVLIVCLASCSKSPKIESDQQNGFVKFFGGSGLDIGSCVVQCADGGYAITGTRLKAKDTTAFLIRTDSYGNEVSWSPVYIGNSLNTKGYNIIYTSDGDFMITGSVETSTNNYDVMVTKISSTGSTIWYKTFGGSGNDEGFCSLELTNGNYFIGGYTESSPYNTFKGKDAWLLNLDVNGNLLWQKNYGTNQNDQCNQILKFGSNLILIGTTYGFQTSDTIPNIFLVEVNPLNSYTGLGETNYGGQIKTTGIKGVLTNDTSVLVMGNQQFQDSSRIYMVYISGNLNNVIYNSIWGKNIQSSNNEWGYDILNNAGQIITLGSVRTSTYLNFMIQPFNLAGNPLPLVTTNTIVNQIIYSGIVSSDNHLVFTGQNIVNGFSQIVLVKTNLPY